MNMLLFIQEQIGSCTSGVRILIMLYLLSCVVYIYFVLLTFAFPFMFWRRRNKLK